VRDTFFAQILAYLAQGMHEETDRAVTRLREFIIAAETRHHLEVVDAFVARIALIRGDLAAAGRWLESSAPPALGADDFKAIELPNLTRIKVLVAIGTPATLAEADGLLTAFVARARATHMALALLEGLAVQALLHEVRGDPGAAARALRESLAMAAPEQIVQRYAYLGPGLVPVLRRLLAERTPYPHARNVLDALESVLAEMPGVSAIESHQNSAENPLTERELDVVRLLERRLTNNEISEELFISPITVKNHIAHITQKLGVSGRRAAVERAGELGLLLAAS
jgi:LuxR family maltose regulon positive regulatory protein